MRVIYKTTDIDGYYLVRYHALHYQDMSADEIKAACEAQAPNLAEIYTTSPKEYSEIANRSWIDRGYVTEFSLTAPVNRIEP